MSESDQKILATLFPTDIREKWKLNDLKCKGLQEIRLRVCKPLQLRYQSKQENMENNIPDADELRDIFLHICGSSVYAYEKERENGFITVKGGHRIGFVGDVSAYQGDRYLVKHIASMNMRIAHEMIGVSEQVITYCIDHKVPLNTLVISPPGLGKTTLLRDMSRELAEKWNVGVVDERGEIAGAYLGIPTLNCGKNADVITGADKEKGIAMLIRTMSPQIIVIDEIGTDNDAKGIERASISGCAILASIHGKNIEDVCEKEEMKHLIQRKRFQRYVLIEQEGTGERTAKIFDENRVIICRGKLLPVV